MTSDFSQHKNALRQLGDAGLLLDSPEDLERYQCGARHDQGQAAFVLRPSSTEQVSKCVAYCVANHIQLIPQSGNTGLVAGSTPDLSGQQVILSLERINRLVDINLANRSAHVGAGVRLSDLNSHLADHKLFFPIDLGADPMIGGMLATNTGGAQFLKYGDVRDNTLGLKVVLGDQNGTVLDLTRSLRKDNTGVDLKHLFIGTGGAFGVITECVINLQVKPQQSASALLVPRDSNAVISLLTMLEQQLGPQLTAFEYMSGNAMRHALSHVSSLRNPFAGESIPDLAILVAATREWPSRENEPTIDDCLEQVLAEVWESSDSPIEDALVGRPEEFWALRHSLSEGVRHAGYLFGFDLGFDRDQAMQFRQSMQPLLTEQYPELELCDFGHIGDGGLHFNLVHTGAKPDDLKAYEQALRDWVYDIAVSQFNGSFSAEHALGRRNQRYYDKYTPEAIKQIADSLKQSVSPGVTSSLQLGSNRFAK